MKISFPHNQRNILFVLLVLGFSIYSNVLHGEFISDDHVHIVGNYAVRDVLKFDNIWHAFNTRFLPGVSFALNYAAGGLDPFGYHLVNILLHIVTAFVVYQLIVVILRTPAVSASYDDKKRRSLALVGALIFLCHPIQTQAVAFITQRFVVMATLCYLLAVLLYIRSRLEDRQDLYGASLGATLLAAFSKEMTITIPLALLLVENVLFKTCFKKHLAVAIKRVLPFCAVLALLPLSLWMDTAGSNLGLKAQVFGRDINWNYFLTEINVLRTYLRLLILPINQVHDYDYPIAQGLFEWPTLLSAALLSGLLWAAVYLRRKDPIISFCIFWFFLTTSVEVAVVSVVNRGVIYEHWLYLPMAGFAFLAAVFLRRVASTDKIYRACFVLLVLVYSLLTYQRNFVWQTEVGFWDDNLRKAPQKAGTYFGMGRAWERKGYDELATRFYLKALCYDPSFAYAHNNLALIYAEESRDDLAMEHLAQAVATDPFYGIGHNNLGFILFLNGRYSEAVKHYQHAIALQGQYPQGVYYLAQCYAKLGEKERARDLTQRAIALYKKRNDPQGALAAEEFLRTIP